MNLTWETIKQAEARLREALAGPPRPLPGPPNLMLPLGGVRIIEDRNMVERVLYPRSPGRARRRMRLGHPQHYAMRPRKTAYRLPDGSMVMHPAMAAELRRR